MTVPKPVQVVGLVMAKAPVPGLVKTRLADSVGAVVAAELAALALLDTIDVVERTFGAGRCHLSMAGDLTEAPHGREIAERLGWWDVHRQRGEGMGARLANAHEDVGRRTGGAVVQVGMDTPHLPVSGLRRVARSLAAGGHDAVVGPACDGGWWVLGLRDPRRASVLADVAMSTSHTCADTVTALEAAGSRVTRGEVLRDIDTSEDAHAVAEEHCGRFGQAWRRLMEGETR